MASIIQFDRLTYCQRQASHVLIFMLPMRIPPAPCAQDQKSNTSRTLCVCEANIMVQYCCDFRSCCMVVDAGRQFGLFASRASRDTRSEDVFHNHLNNDNVCTCNTTR